MGEERCGDGLMVSMREIEEVGRRIAREFDPDRVVQERGTVNLFALQKGDSPRGRRRARGARTEIISRRLRPLRLRVR